MNHFFALPVLLFMASIGHPENSSLNAQKSHSTKTVMTQKQSNAAPQAVVKLASVTGKVAVSRQSGKCAILTQNRKGLNRSAQVASHCKK